MFVTTSVPFSVQQRKLFFERLSLDEKNEKSRHPLMLSKSTPTSPDEHFTLFNVPPKKPKRTFEHDIYMESKMWTSAPGSSRCSSCSPEEQSTMPRRYGGTLKHQHQRKVTPIQLKGKPKYFQLSHDYENSPRWNSKSSSALQNGRPLEVSFRRHKSQDSLYAQPIICKTSLDQLTSSNDGSSSLYYAASDLLKLDNNNEKKPRQIVNPYAETECYYYNKELPKTPDEEGLKFQKNSKNGSKGITRKFAFKKSTRESSQESQGNGKQEGASDVEDLPGSGSLERRLTRARLVRRRTLALYDNQVKAFVSRKAPQLFESAFLVELKKISDDVNCSPRSAYKPAITFRFPTELATPISPPELFFPDFSHNPSIEPDEYWRGDEEFVIALTNHIAERKNAYCIKFLPTKRDEAVSPRVFVVISPIKSSNFYLDLARNAVGYAKTSTKSLECFLKSVFNQSFPQKRGSCLVVVEKGANGTKRRLEIRNLGTAIGKRGISEVMQRMSPEIVVCVIAALLGDQRVLIAGSTVGEVAQAVQCLEALLLPLVWPHTYVPVVPDNLTELAHNPTPYLMGILRSNLLPLRDLIVDDTNNNDKIQMDFMFVDIDNGLINPRPEHFDCNKDREAWRTQSAQAYAQKMGIPKKASSNLIKGFRGAMAGGPGPAADVKIENAMLHWYALLFGHYKSAGANTEWGDKIKAKLIASHPNPSLRPYLAYLCETAMFTEWIEKRQRSDSSPPLGEEVCGSEEALNRKLDDLASQQLHSSSNSSSKPFSSLVTKVSNVLSFTGSRKK